MKQTDIFGLILIGGVGAIASFFLCNALLGDPNEATTSFTRLVRVISSDLAEPDAEIFNGEAINPTVEVYVGDCEDIDRNGMLDTAELIACGKEAPEESDTGEDIENAEGETAGGETEESENTEGE